MTTSFETRTDMLLNNLAGLANQSLYESEQTHRTDVDAPQLAWLQRRFAQLRDQVRL